jgi:hypothetical protein
MLFGFRRVRFRNNIGNMHRLAANSKRGHPNNLSRDWLQFAMLSNMRAGRPQN